MRKFTRKEIAEIRADINNGTVYCGIHNGFGVGRIFKSVAGNFYYEYYGQSAVNNTIADLAWLLETIFADCETVTPAEWSDYHINYVPIDKQYRGIDVSPSHPNILGV
jgi:hypothetical protein